MSRYYDPVTHRFINADGYFQSGGNILDANMHAYCANNPIINSDTSGSCYYAAGVWSHDNWEYLYGYKRKPDPKAKDITKKLDEAIKNHKQEFSDYCENNNSVDSAIYFANKSKTGGDWDLKSQDDWGLNKNSSYLYHNTILRYDDIGNIHYGYVGRVAFDEKILLKMAGYVQIFSGTSKLEFWLSNFDDPRDQQMIHYGSTLWDRDMVNLDE